MLLRHPAHHAFHALAVGFLGGHGDLERIALLAAFQRIAQDGDQPTLAEQRSDGLTSAGAFDFLPVFAGQRVVEADNAILLDLHVPHSPSMFACGPLPCRATVDIAAQHSDGGGCGHPFCATFRMATAPNLNDAVTRV